MKTATTAPPLTVLSAIGTSAWLDSLSRSMLETGELAALIDDGVAGVTANPAIIEKAVLGGDDYDAALARLGGRPRTAVELYETLAIDDVVAAADVLRPVYERSEGLDGYASLEVAPAIAHDAERTIASARDLWTRLDRPNVMIKIPATGAGVEAIRRSVAEGINVNVTLLFSVRTYARVIDAYLSGLEDRLERGQPIEHVRSVASFFVSRVDGVVDPLLQQRGRADLAGEAGIANARHAYARFQAAFAGGRFDALRAHGAHVQRPLWASTGVKHPAYRDVRYVEELAGPDTVNTMPLATLRAFADHGEARDALSGSGAAAAGTLGELSAAGIDLEDVAGRLLDDGIDAFSGAMDRLLAGVKQRR